jgi:hypothetical protein
MSEPAPPPPDDPELIAWVRAGCTCSATVVLVTDEHVDSCPVAHTTDLTIAWYRVHRHGKPKREGGPGVKWVCSCGGEPTMTYGRGRRRQVGAGATCRHVRALFIGNVAEVSHPSEAAGRPNPGKGYYVILTSYGDDVLRADWATKALRDPQS